MVASYSTDDDVMSRRTQEWSLVDEKTSISFAVGFVAGMGGLNDAWAMVVVIGFEALMAALEEESLVAPFKRPIIESAGNQLVNTLVGTWGVSMGEAFRNKRLAEYQRMSAASGLSGTSFVSTQFPLVRTRPVLGIRHVPQR